jgi:signal transduction histidine kinase
VGDRRFGLERRATPVEVREQSVHVSGMREACAILEATPTVLLLLNEHRQVIFANQALARLLGIPSIDSIYGQRPGELLECDRLDGSGCDGCGTTEACQVCGMAHAVEASEEGTAAIQECRITRRRDGRALDLRVSSTPFSLNGGRYTVIALTDISQEKRRQTLERLFLHDLGNTVEALMSYADLLRRRPDIDTEEIGDSVGRLCCSLAEEIEAQRQLEEAEAGDLTVQREEVDARQVLRNVAESYRHHDSARNRNLVVDPEVAACLFSSDSRLITRVIGNMALNALEGCERYGTVTLGCKVERESVCFTVHNPGVIPRDVQLQIFQRSFSTKGPGRGLGTYSVKLLGERYLDGSVSFTSDADAGTTFFVRLPRQEGPAGASGT